ncbi:MAG: class I SAM-dependent rRNA methyltransferase [Chitinophagales bacterium]|nr:class I SAM-dependent rRNA methyltransferase [Chitinophagales bacterium]MDW8419009.1 class I SAM-dependent rRNA methyltransferase [Chitinophagales bacterium]
MRIPQIVLHQHKTASLRRFHPWVFSGAIRNLPEGLRAGDVVEVTDEAGHVLGTGHYAAGSIAVRVFAFERVDDLRVMWREKLARAMQWRSSLGLLRDKPTNACRLVFGEGDGMPGLVADWYNGVIVMQCHHAGMYRERSTFTELWREIFGDALHAVYDKSAVTLHGAEEVQDGFLYGTAGDIEIYENNLLFKVDVVNGQKTGFFLDQRDNRRLLQRYVAGKKVLNAFCYSGAFSVYALAAGAREVHAVDASARAIGWADENVARNGFEQARHRSFIADVFEFLSACDDDYEVMVLDPPAFAKNIKARHQALKAYTRLNEAAIRKIKPGGIIFTFSCSQVMDDALFYGAVMHAAIRAGRRVNVLHTLGHPADHPVSIFHPEGKYLKGLALSVNE